MRNHSIQLKLPLNRFMDDLGIFINGFILLILVTLSHVHAQPYAKSLAVIELKTGIYRIQAEVADTPETRQTGLMNRSAMPNNSGMLFIFDEKATHCFWMRNTKIPLAIAFIGDDGKIINIEEMQANTENNHCPKAYVRFALEMNQKWFSDRALGPGTVIQGLPKK